MLWVQRQGNPDSAVHGAFPESTFIRCGFRSERIGFQGPEMRAERNSASGLYSCRPPVRWPWVGVGFRALG